MADQNLTGSMDVYRELQLVLHALPVGFPETKSGVEIRILKQLFTPEEAKIATYLKFSMDDLEPLEKIFERVKDLGYSLEELREHLDSMVSKGAITGYKKEGNKVYSLAMFMIGIFEWQVNKLTKEFIDDMHQFMKEGFMLEAGSTQISQLRTIPVEASLTHELNVASYDDLKSIVDNVESTFMITNCVCRQAFDILDRHCKATDRREVCMGWGDMAQLYIQEGWGREITKQEALEILEKNQEEHLIIQPGNAQKPEFICSCCTCCCEGLKGLKRLPNPADFISTNHYAEVDPDLCSGCETCIDICQLDALIMNDGISSVNRKRCIGCGNCVVGCPSEAIILKKKDDDHVYALANNTADLYDNIWNRKKVLMEREQKRQVRKEKRSKT